MSVGKKLLISIGWFIAFIAVGKILEAANLTTSSDATASSLASNTFILLIISVVGFAPLVMAILVWFGRPHWLYKRNGK